MYDPIHNEYKRNCPCPDCDTKLQSTRMMFDKWWKKDRPVTVHQLNRYDEYHRLYYAALYGFNAAMKMRGE